MYQRILGRPLPCPKPREMSQSHNPGSTQIQASALTWSNSLSCLVYHLHPLLYTAKLISVQPYLTANLLSSHTLLPLFWYDPVSPKPARFLSSSDQSLLRGGGEKRKIAIS